MAFLLFFWLLVFGFGIDRLGLVGRGIGVGGGVC